MTGWFDRVMARIEAYAAGGDDPALAVIDNLFLYGAWLVLVLVLFLVVP